MQMTKFAVALGMSAATLLVSAAEKPAVTRIFRPERVTRGNTTASRQPANQRGGDVKAGELNQIMYKGWVWKTYEGRLIQSGFKGAKTGGSIQSNEFNFSVTDKAIADSLMRCSGKNVELHYKEYLGVLPWRGMQRHIVDKVISTSSLPE